MGNPATPKDVMLFCSILFNSADSAGQAVAELKNVYGDTAFETIPLAFPYTSYYEKEMGSPLNRILMGFEAPVQRNSLPEVKNRTNTIEDKLKVHGKRTVNLDPGLLSLENICLATTKPYSHRIYLDKGIWAEVTLMYQKDSYHPLPWTYPDYASRELIDIFNTLRELYKESSRCRGV